MLHTPWTALENTLLRVLVCYALLYLLQLTGLVISDAEGTGMHILVQIERRVANCRVEVE
jgi:hypothetical protein